ncbi:MAG: nucleotidyltransferase domain-containing protein [Bifidobacteriaceae bacterium]|jgi:predicted nucleotidyltransferase|nr:nucleotidyltransferase domain-containing protein [Bifidobacteriaceae bacterium]
MDFVRGFGGVITGPRGAVLSALLGTGTPLSGRQIHRLISHKASLTSVQKELRELTALGLVKSDKIGASGIHTINEEHALVPPLREMADPFAMLRRIVAESAGDAQAVLLFGSLAKGEATRDSDIDLAVIGPDDWGGSHHLQESVERSFGNPCDVLVLTEAQYFSQTEPVAAEIRNDGITLYGEKPLKQGIQ